MVERSGARLSVCLWPWWAGPSPALVAILCEQRKHSVSPRRSSFLSFCAQPEGRVAHPFLCPSMSASRSSSSPTSTLTASCVADLRMPYLLVSLRTWVWKARRHARWNPACWLLAQGQTCSRFHQQLLFFPERESWGLYSLKCVFSYSVPLIGNPIHTHQYACCNIAGRVPCKRLAAGQRHAQMACLRDQQLNECLSHSHTGAVNTQRLNIFVVRS